VSCASAIACTAVGNTQVTLAEAWNGRTWAIQPTPNPPGATLSSLYNVACTTAIACTAVGFNINVSGPWTTLAEAWDGSAWAIEPTPNPPGGTFNVLSDVSCTSVTACTAVGRYSLGTMVTLAEAWDGQTWTIQPTPNPPGATNSVLSGVSCTTGTACTGVGASENDSGTTVTLAELWDGTLWTIQPTPNPPGATYSVLGGVSCTSAVACIAVGRYLDISYTEVTLAEVWNGSTWAVQPTPNPAGAVFSSLSDVSCTSATACTAVGEYVDSSGGAHTLAEAWNGSSWAIQLIPRPPGSSLSGVSCPSATACMSAGYFVSSWGTDVTLAERYAA